MSNPQVQIPRAARFVVPVVILALLFIPVAGRFYRSVPAGHVAVATFFGKIRPVTYPAGLHVPVNPFYKWHEYNARQKTHTESAGVPSQDQLTTMVDISVQYRLIGDRVASVLEDTGTAADAKEVHLVPKLRSVLREQGKTIKRAEDFFLEETQQRLQDNIQESLDEYLRDRGIEVQDVLIRDISLPPNLIAQIGEKKEAEQQAEREKANLDKFRTERERDVVSAETQRRAAEEEAAMMRVLADARAYEIEMINEAISSNPAYLQLQALKTLEAISKDPAAKLYFMDGNAPMPLPLMNIGDPLLGKAGE